jgi:uncharacterized cofD-like protein
VANMNRQGSAIIRWLAGLFISLALLVAGILFLVNSILLRITVSGERPILGVLFVGIALLVGYLGTRRFLKVAQANLPAGFLSRFGRLIRGPRIVVIGGGTGLGTILRGLKEISANLTAIVTVADDGGSSGRLRKDFGILPPGDIRNCLVAMADTEPLMEKLMQYRFNGGSDLAGHNFGNLFLAALTGVTGDFELAIKASGEVLAVRGQVLPATLNHVTLKAELDDGSAIYGESAIAHSQRPIHRVQLEPDESRPVTEAITAIREAQVILLGPGSLYTSIIPNLLVKEITAAIRQSTAVKLYICNAMTQPGETAGYKASDHIRAIIDHAGPNLIDIALVNTEPVPPEVLERYAEEGAQPVPADFDEIRELGVEPLGVSIIQKTTLIRHDAAKLAQIVQRLTRRQRIGQTFGRAVARRIYRIFKS